MTHRLFDKQLLKATRADGSVDMDLLNALVSDAYVQNDRNRERTERSISLMVEELEERHQELEGREVELSRQNDLFKDAIENIGHGLSMYDRDNRLVVCNERFVAMYGLQGLDIRPGISADVIRDHFNRSGLFISAMADLGELSQSDGVREDEYRLADGRIVQVSRHPRDGGGWVMMHRDITETRHLEDERERAEESARRHRELEYRAEMSNKAKSEFLAVMSHEIRTPLNAVLGLTTILLDTELTASQRESLEMIEASGSNLLHLLNDILDFSKLDAGRMEFEAQAFSPGGVIDSAYTIAKVPADRKALNLRIEISPDLPEGLRGDADRIRQVIYNLATNAVKFTERGEVVLGARVVSREPGKATVEYWITDTGIGISETQLSRLFQNFAQADDSIARRFGGTGLGLAICKKIVEQMGGDISVTSEPGVGSRFSFRLCLPVVSLAEAQTATAPEAATDLHQLLAAVGRPVRVLLAEDNATNQVVFRKMLEEFGLQIHVAANGIEAFVSAPQVKPDVIYMDMQMPEMNGIEATRQIRRLGDFCATVPIVAVSANAFPEDVKAYREAGMSDFIAKPVRKRQLVENLAGIVQSLVTGKAASAAPMVRAADAAAAPSDIDQSAFDELKDEIGDDGVEMALDIFLVENRPRIAALAVPLVDSDRKRIRSEAHALKGAAGMFGFTILSSLAMQIEVGAETIAAKDYGALADQLVAALARLEACLRECKPAHETQSRVA